MNIHSKHASKLPVLDNIHLGDCNHIMQQLPPESIDLIITDPPYLVNYQSRDGRSIVGDKKSDWLKPAYANMYRLLKPHHLAISFYGWNHADSFLTAFKQAGFRIVGHFVFAKQYSSRTGITEARHECAYILSKGKPKMPYITLPDVLPWGRYTGNKYHPTQKPVEIFRTLLKSFSQIGDIVLDPFTGSGSTLMACQQLRRSYIGMEIDQTYYHQAVKRLNRYSI